MANWCLNGVSFEGPPGIIEILIGNLFSLRDEALQRDEGFRLPYLPSELDASYIFELDQPDPSFDLHFSTKWGPDPVAMAIMCYALGITFTMWADECSCCLLAEYRLTDSGVLEYRELTEEEYNDIPRDEDDDELDGAAEIREDRLSSKDWIPYEMDVSLLKRLVPHESVV